MVHHHLTHTGGGGGGIVLHPVVLMADRVAPQLQLCRTPGPPPPAAGRRRRGGDVAVAAAGVDMLRRAIVRGAVGAGDGGVRGEAGGDGRRVRVRSILRIEFHFRSTQQ